MFATKCCNYPYNSCDTIYLTHAINASKKLTKHLLKLYDITVLRAAYTEYDKKYDHKKKKTF